MLPQRFGSFKSLFHPFDRSSTSSRAGSQEYSVPDAVRALREISCCDDLHQNSSSSEELQLDLGKESHVDSEDSGLLKEGYFLGGSPSRLKRSQVNREVNKWKEIASKKLEELTNKYNKGCSKKKVSFSLPLGIETNRKLVVEESDDISTLFSKGNTDKRDIDDDLDLRRNEEFMRDVHRVLKGRKNPETLSKRTLSEEYDRQFSKKMSAASEWARRVLAPVTDQKALEDQKNPAAVGTSDAGAGGDNTSGPVKVIFDELSRMMTKNKIWKNSKAATTRNEILRRAEEKRGRVMGDVEDKFSETEEANDRIAKVDNIAPMTGTEQDNAVNIMKSHVEKGSHTYPDKLISYRSNLGHQIGQDTRIEKVANYLERSPDPCWTECSEGSSIDDDLSFEQEKYLFDSLAGEFLKSSRKQAANRGKISKNDGKLLKFLVKRYLKRCELGRIDELLNSNLDDPNLEVPPYEDATDREEFFMKKLIGKYIRRGMRTDLEDKIAWIYYKYEAVKNRSEQSSAIQEKASVDKEIKRMVEAFKSSGKNSSLNRTVMELVREQNRENPNLSHQEVLSMRESIRNMVVERFARMYLVENGATNTQEIESPRVGTNVPTGGLEKFNMNGSSFDVLWKFSGPAENASDGDDEFEMGRNSPQLEEQSKEANTSRKVDIPAAKNRESSGSRLKDKFWCEQQQRVRRSSWKPKIACSPIAKRALSLIGGSKAPSMKTVGNAKVDKGRSVEYIRRRMREDNVKWLLEQKAKLWEARKREAKRLDKFTMALPKKLEHVVERRNRFQEELDEVNYPPKRTARAKSKR